MTMKYKQSLIGYNAVSYVNEDTEIISEDKTDIMDCALGTNPFGHTKLLDTASPDIMKNIHLYPDYPYVELKDEIIKNWSGVASLGHKNIHIANGSISILERINRVFMVPGSKALGCCPQFTDYSCDVKAMGGVFDYVLLKETTNYKYDVNEIINAIKPDYKIIYLDNPNNPTGQVLLINDIRLILKEAAKSDICVIIDEAYADFISKEESSISLIGEFDNLIVTRSFSKGLGLAGIRIGYLVASEEFCKYYAKANSPFPISNMAAAMAKTALSDKSFIEESIEKISEYKKAIIESLTKIKVAETDGRVPIMLLMCDDPKVNLFNMFYKNKIATERGSDFTGLSINSIRFKVPKDCARVIGLIKEIEKSL
ncbi:MAG: histidinol-phosphate transaminase [Clostridiaceae bacterium]